MRFFFTVRIYREITSVKREYLRGKKNVSVVIFYLVFFVVIRLKNNRKDFVLSLQKDKIDNPKKKKNVIAVFFYTKTPVVPAYYVLSQLAVVYLFVYYSVFFNKKKIIKKYYVSNIFPVAFYT